jgi:ribonuclease BN (tRNA processing enzyme)
MAANENATGFIADLHATPSVWGLMAEAANVGQVVVSHISTSDSNQLQENLQILADNYSGEVLVAEDLMCVDLP